MCSLKSVALSSIQTKKIQAELERKNGYIADKDKAISQLEEELEAATEEVRHLHSQVSSPIPTLM